MDSAEKLARRSLAAHGIVWAGMAADGQIGRAREHKGRWRLDFGRRWGPRFLYAFRGIPFETEEIARAILAHVEREVARGRGLADVLDEAAPAAQRIEPLLSRWLDVFRQRVESGRRQPRTLMEYERWAGKGEAARKRKRDADHFSFWRERSLAEVDPASLEEWTFWLARRGLSLKSTWNVLAGFHSFLSWVAESRRGFVVPRFPWPDVEEHQPAILSAEDQGKILSAIPWEKAGIFFCLAETAMRPSEARALRVRDWNGSDEIRVSRAAKDRKTRGVVRGLKARNAKVVPCPVFMLRFWLDEFVTPERRLADPDGPLFPNPDGRLGGWWAEKTMARTWAAACAAASVPKVKLYEGTKHSTATRLKGLGADDRVLAQLMGHRDLRSVEKYAKLSPQTVAKILSGLERGKGGS